MPSCVRAIGLLGPFLFWVGSAFQGAHANPLSCPDGDLSKIYVRIDTGHAFALDPNSGEFDERLNEAEERHPGEVARTAPNIQSLLHFLTSIFQQRPRVKKMAGTATDDAARNPPQFPMRNE